MWVTVAVGVGGAGGASGIGSAAGGGSKAGATKGALAATVAPGKRGAADRAPPLDVARSGYREASSQGRTSAVHACILPQSASARAPTDRDEATQDDRGAPGSRQGWAASTAARAPRAAGVGGPRGRLVHHQREGGVLAVFCVHHHCPRADHALTPGASAPGVRSHMSGDAARTLNPEFPNLDPEVVAGYRNAPETIVADVIGGELSLMPRPRRRHARAASRLGVRLAASDLLTRPLSPVQLLLGRCLPPYDAPSGARSEPRS